MKRLPQYSQHFLRSPRLVKELVGHTSLKSQDTVLDIGAGSGVISSVLSEKVARVIAIESEPNAAKKLRENMQAHLNVDVQEGDFLAMPLPRESYKVFANIPFHLSSPILRRLTEAPNPPDTIYLIVQKQFANKLLPDSDRFTGQLGMMIGPLFAVRIRKHLMRTDFWPHPNVDTVLLELMHRSTPILEANAMPAYRRFIEACFSDPKKFAKTPRAEVNLPTDIKPSQMKLEQWIELFAAYTALP
jgi:16S rRNA A1518/A1519 N6-dimethyltransferase RsmA/KsgA/DIM1 with predicted DNA glycosylase/AP lyase activity